MSTIDEPRRSGVYRGFFAARLGMPAWIPHLLFMIAAMVVLLFVSLAVFRALRGLLVLLLISLFLATAIEPAVNYLARRGWRRGLATGAIFLLVFLAGSALTGLMVPLIIDQTILLIDRIPDYIDDLAVQADKIGLEFSSERVDNALTNFDQTLQDYAADLAGSAFGVGTTLLTTVFQGLTIALFTFYLVADAPRFRRVLMSVLPAERQREVLRIWDIAIDKTGGYFYSRALLAGIATFTSWVVFRILDVPFALALALWLGVLSQFVPVFGTYIGGAVPALIALLESPGTAVGVVVFIIVYQQIENYLLSPRITARTMSLHPAVAFGSAIAGGTLMGVPGTLMALPVTATIQAFISTYLHRHEVIESELTAEPPPHPNHGGAKRRD
ncbi:MAG: AI-2E family transporter [Acidimicrobiia bacterium]|nr:AI-2E family transporter [Acidimicrobiia bacterium]NNL71181.1 AI-2E family transporter [Acidimicrobiia bacterium]